MNKTEKENKVSNAYGEKKTNVDEKNKLQIWFKILDVLDDYGYGLEASIKDGVPYLNLTKDTD